MRRTVAQDDHGTEPAQTAARCGLGTAETMRRNFIRRMFAKERS